MEARLFEILAVFVTYRRLLVVLFSAPLAVLMLPAVVQVYLSITNWLTAGHSVLYTFNMMTLTLLGQKMIRRYAPSPKQRDVALEQSKLVLPILSILASKFCILFLEQWLGLRGILMWTLPQVINFSNSVRLAAILTLLSASILLRFVGPLSLIRCSCGPLQSNPASTSLKSLWNQFNIDSLISFLARPSDVHTLNHQQRSLFRWNPRHQRRYQNPSNMTSMGQLMLSIILGSFVALMIPTVVENQRMSSFIVCNSTLMGHFVVSCLLGDRPHELDPQQRRVSSLVSLLQTKHKRLLAVTYTGLPTYLFSILSIALAVAAGTLISDSDESQQAWSYGKALRWLLTCIVTGFSTLLYLIFINDMARWSLCVPGVNLKKILQDLSEDSSHATLLEIVLYSLLHGDDVLVQSILFPTRRTAGLSLTQEEESFKARENQRHMARILLGTDPHVRASNLEQDMLRVALLEMMGGGEGTPSGDPRHEQAIQKWILPPATSLWTEERPVEPVAIPLVRGLCAFAGGLGQALFLCSLPHKDARRLEFNLDDGPFSSWWVPPGARACAEWAISASARLVVATFTSKESSLYYPGDWKGSPLATLVPVVLEAAFALRSGASRHQSCDSLVTTCDNAACVIGETLGSLEGRPSLELNSLVDKECRVWLEQLLQTYISPQPRKIALTYR